MDWGPPFHGGRRFHSARERHFREQSEGCRTVSMSVSCRGPPRLGKLLAQLLAQTVQRVTRRSAVPSRYEIFRPTLLAHSTKVLSGRIGAVVCNGRVRFEHQL
jgi:hypothetical protein